MPIVVGQKTRQQRFPDDKPVSLMERLEHLEEGMPVIYDGDKLTRVTTELAVAFRPGDRLVVVQRTGDLLHIPAVETEIAAAAVGAAHAAFGRMDAVTDEQLTVFYEAFARRLVDESTSLTPVAEVAR